MDELCPLAFMDNLDEQAIFSPETSLHGHVESEVHTVGYNPSYIGTLSGLGTCTFRLGYVIKI